MKTSAISALFAASLLAAAPAAVIPGVAYAHGSMKPQHGGMVQMSGETLFELVKSAKGVDVYISEEDEPLPASEFSAKLIVTNASGAKATTAMSASKANRFAAPGVKLQAGSKVVVSLVEKSSGTKTFATFKL
ncbi:hypothetical protein [Novosphingobium pentaromativorans]|uniref:Uncharacterized protein n=1 Tax=Novosphingobium pentaromativorans US6-1 TaxID=1088721 RepID=G6EG08_9SPHN|nr:hypothetical protein [Novosphingobium pentaromativorans]AIT82294.1 hypothetical protein JI59_22575 [Novosphingobium pentaromativorans US6-1]EHJ59697.1 hypothetical protein NSU_3279 [Novosphingobium pentaromativorans US6-1]